MRHFRVLPDGSVGTSLRGYQLMKSPFLNKSLAFTHSERETLGLTGLLPRAVMTLDQQVELTYKQFEQQPNALLKNIYLTALHDRNQVLFYSLLTRYIEEMLPIVYTPTVGTAIQHYSQEFRRSLGIYLSIDQPEDIERAFDHFGADSDEIDLIVATDGERILGIGDWGVGGIDIANGKLVVYTAAAGIDPRRVIPVVIDVGTDRDSLLNDPLYLGIKHKRVRGEAYYAFIDRYVEVATRKFPHALIHWEDFAQSHARPILERYKNKICTFNDDIQGTGAISLAAVLTAARLTKMPLSEQRIVIFGSGSAGIGIAEQIRDAMVREGLTPKQAQKRFWCIDRPGLLIDTLDELRDFQRPYARAHEEIDHWTHNKQGSADFLEVVKQVKPTLLIGASTVAGAFNEVIVKEMAKHVKHPVILPLSNPTSASEAVPEDLLRWTEGRALIATGSPFDPVSMNGQKVIIGQANNAFVFPGIGLGTIVTRALRVTDGMLVASAEAIAEFMDQKKTGSPSLLPEVKAITNVSKAVALKVAEKAIEEGVARIMPDDLEKAVSKIMWTPSYPNIRPV